MVYPSLPCYWCSYLKGITTNTTRRLVLFSTGKNASIPMITELVQCPTCEQELNISLNEQIQLIQDYKPELKDWLTHNQDYMPEC